MENNNNNSTFEFLAGGTLKVNHPSYVERPADRELYNAARNGDFCYVLTARQMGKSSMMVRTAKKLNAINIQTAIVDLTSIGSDNVTVEQWYLSLLTKLKTQLKLDVTPETWWGENKPFSPISRFIKFLRDEILAKIDQRIVIFIDEIDSTLKLDFTDNFFAAIRATYNSRATEPIYNRLTFVLLGVATPQDLIQDAQNTPFNIGQKIDLKDFSWSDARVLREGITALVPEYGEAALKRIFYWTNGHPYLTQRLCSEVTKDKRKQWQDADIDNLVSHLFLSKKASHETNIQYIRKYVKEREDHSELVELYERVYDGKHVIESEQSIPQNQLKLIGLINPQNGSLMVRNNIYRNVFDKEWIRGSLGRSETSPQSSPETSPRIPSERLHETSSNKIPAWLFILLGIVTLLLIGTGLWFAGIFDNEAATLSTSTPTSMLEITVPTAIDETTATPEIQPSATHTPNIIPALTETTTNSPTPPAAETATPTITVPTETSSPTVTVTSTATNTPPPIATIPPPPPPSPTNLNFTCTGDIESFFSNQSVNFEWLWNGETSGGSYLEIRVGPPAQLSSIGIVPLGQEGRQGRWVVPASMFFDPNYYDYEWQVVHMAANRSTIIAASEKGCIHIEPAN
ncbi:MAG: AAA-like domain-containing protein [Anaerolineales bacterium]|nr:AAA-like domain-containing protein [Anaerolineales bacterium]